MFDNLSDCDCMWTQLARSITGDGYGEVWYWNGKRHVCYDKHFHERWLPSFKKTNPSFEPDVIFARGGFPEYDPILRQNTKAFKIYYGAGKRFMPQTKFTDFNLILFDTSKQQQAAKRAFPKSRVEMFIKPAADNVFKPISIEKQYDIIFVGNEPKKGGFKGHDFAFSNIPHHYKVLCVGMVSKQLRKKFPHIEFTGWIPRKEIPLKYAISKIAVVAADGRDSCPRVIPESLACNCPLLVLDGVDFWHEKYITPQTGRLTTRKSFTEDVIQMLDDYFNTNWLPAEYYQQNLSLRCAANHIQSFIPMNK